MSAEGAAPARPMKYPYTFAAKIAQFPYAYYFKYNWMVRYHIYAAIVCLPIFYKIGKLCEYDNDWSGIIPQRRKYHLRKRMIIVKKKKKDCSLLI